MRNVLMILAVIAMACVASTFLAVPWLARKPEVSPASPVAADTAALPLEATFTTAGRVGFEDLNLSFKYPNFWLYGELHSDQVDATVRIIRPGDNRVHAGATLLVTRSPTALHAPKPMLPPGTKVIQEQRRPFGTTEMIFVEFATTTNIGDYQRGLSLESTDAKRYVSLTASCHGPPGSNDAVDQQFQELRATFDAVLSSLTFEPKVP